jgi:protein MpaA
MASITVMLSTLTAALVVGHSVQGRPIRLIHVEGTGPRVLVVGCIHGNECAGAAVVAALRRAHPREDLWLIPTLNPDGLAHDVRQNAHGVDLNRNFGAMWQRSGAPWSTYYAGPHPFSEPETQLARRLILRLRPRVTIWFHQHMDVVWAYGRSTTTGRRYARLAQMRLLHRPWLPGSATNWQNHLPDRERSLTVELPAGPLDARELDLQVGACLRVALAAA